MYICYLDESGTADASGNTEHFVLLGLAIPAEAWKAKDAQVAAIKKTYGLEDAEVHTAWMLPGAARHRRLRIARSCRTPSRRSGRANDEPGAPEPDLENFVETPLFVDSSLTSMIQLADICAYATRRFFDNAEDGLYREIDPRFDRSQASLVGLRHYTAKFKCTCVVCIEHGRPV